MFRLQSIALCLLWFAIASVCVLVTAQPSRPKKYFFANNTVVQVCSPTVVRIARVPVPGNFSAVDNRVSLIAERDWEPYEPKVTSKGGVTTFTLAEMVVNVDEASGAVSFSTATGEPLLQEKSHWFNPTVDLQNPTFQIQQKWELQDGESL